MLVTLGSRYWQGFVLAQVVGTALVTLGATYSVIVQLLGVILLFPGSLIATTLPLHRLWHPALLRYWQTDRTGLSNLLYIPVALISNLLVWWAFRAYRLRGESQAR